MLKLLYSLFFMRVERFRMPLGRPLQRLGSLVPVNGFRLFSDLGLYDILLTMLAVTMETVFYMWGGRKWVGISK